MIDYCINDYYDNIFDTSLHCHFLFTYNYEIEIDETIMLNSSIDWNISGISLQSIRSIQQTNPIFFSILTDFYASNYQKAPKIRLKNSFLFANNCSSAIIINDISFSSYKHNESINNNSPLFNIYNSNLSFVSTNFSDSYFAFNNVVECNGDSTILFEANIVNNNQFVESNFVGGINSQCTIFLTDTSFANNSGSSLIRIDENATNCSIFMANCQFENNYASPLFLVFASKNFYFYAIDCILTNNKHIDYSQLDSIDSIFPGAILYANATDADINATSLDHSQLYFLGKYGI